MITTATKKERRSAFSLVEALVAIGNRGVPRGYAIPIYSGVREQAVVQVGVENTDWLNQAIMHHRNLVGLIDITDGPDDASGADEQGVIDLLVEVKTSGSSASRSISVPSPDAHSGGIQTMTPAIHLGW